jgi:hypothetical protein
MGPAKRFVTIGGNAVSDDHRTIAGHRMRPAQEVAATEVTQANHSATSCPAERFATIGRTAVSDDDRTIAGYRIRLAQEEAARQVAETLKCERCRTGRIVQGEATENNCKRET